MINLRLYTLTRNTVLGRSAAASLLQKVSLAKPEIPLVQLNEKILINPKEL